MSIIGFDLCTSAFKDAEKHHPDLMEPYATRLAGAEDAAERIAIMRQGLYETFRRRYPMPPEFWSTPCTPADIAAWDAHVAADNERKRKAAELTEKYKAKATA